MLCAYMPDSIADKCEDYVQQYGDEIIRLIMEMEMDPDEICAELGLCSTIQMPSSNILYGKKIYSKKKTQYKTESKTINKNGNTHERLHE